MLLQVLLLLKEDEMATDFFSTAFIIGALVVIGLMVFGFGFFIGNKIGLLINNKKKEVV